MSSRSRVVHRAMSTWGEVLSILDLRARHFPRFRSAKAAVKSHGFTSEVRATSARTSRSPTPSPVPWARAIFFSSLSRCTVFSPTSSTRAEAAPSVSVMPWVQAMARTRLGSSQLLGGAQSMTALGPAAARALYSRVFRASFSASQASTVVALGAFR